MIRKFLLLIVAIITALVFGPISCSQTSQLNKPISTELASEDIEWLAIAITSEASSVYDGGQWVRCTDEERAAVGWTVINRLKAGIYGKSIKDIVTASGQYAHNQQPISEISELAKQLLGGKMSDTTGGATHFFSPISMPKEGEATGGFDVGGGLNQVTGITKKVYFPSWTKQLVWIGDLNNVRRAYFMFYYSQSPTSLKPAATPKGGTGTSPGDPVPFGVLLEIPVPWESANANVRVLEVNDITERVRYVSVKLELGAAGKTGGIFPYYAHEFRLVGSKGKFYYPDVLDNFKIEVLSGQSTTKTVKFIQQKQVEFVVSGVDPDDSNFLMIFGLQSLSGQEDRNYFFALK